MSQYIVNLLGNKYYFDDLLPAVELIFTSNAAANRTVATLQLA